MNNKDIKELQEQQVFIKRDIKLIYLFLFLLCVCLMLLALGTGFL